MLGIHVLYEFHGCDPAVLNSPRILRRVMRKAVKSGGCTILGDRFHQFNPHGVSGMVVIMESHMAIHTWPEHSYAALDFFTCKLDTHFDAALAVLQEGLGAQRIEYQLAHRGEGIDKNPVTMTASTSPSILSLQDRSLRDGGADT